MTVPESVPLGDSDIPPDFESPSGDAAPLRCHFDGCSNAVIKPARGRPPKYCPDHKGATGTAKGRRKAAWAEAERVEKMFGYALKGVAGGVALLDPIDGRFIAVGAPAVAHEITELLRLPKYKEQREFISKWTAPGDYGPLLLSLLPIIVPILAHHKLLPQLFMPGLTSVPTNDEGVNAA